MSKSKRRRPKRDRRSRKELSELSPKRDRAHAAMGKDFATALGDDDTELFLRV